MRNIIKMAAVMGGGVRYGPELVSNGNMETGSPPTGWAATDCTPFSVADERTGGAGAKSLKLIIAVAKSTGYVISDTSAPLALGSTYRFEAWGKVVSGDHLVSTIYSNTYGNQWGPSALQTSASWIKFTYDFVCNEAGVAHIQLLHIGAAGNEACFDGVSLRKKL